MEPIDILKGALDHLREYGWIQGNYAPNGVKPLSEQMCCSYGALIAVAAPTMKPYLIPDRGTISGLSEAWRVMMAVIRNKGGYYGITDWNDARERTFTEVERTFERAIKLEEQYIEARAKAIREGANDLERNTYLYHRSSLDLWSDNV